MGGDVLQPVIKRLLILSAAAGRRRHQLVDALFVKLRISIDIYEMSHFYSVG
jgi:hypothetical protein